MTGGTAGSGPERWDISITSGKGYVHFSAGELWRYRDLLLMFVKKDIITVYKQTILGPIWFIIQPVFTSLTYVGIFSFVAKIPTGGVPPILFYLGSVAVWNYFSETLSLTSKTFSDNASIFGKVYFPRIILPLSKVLSGMIKFLIQFLLFLLVWGYFYAKGAVVPNAYILLTPVLLVIMAMLSLGFGLFVTSLTTKYRDLTFLLNFGLQLLMYGTPVIYQLSTLQKYPKILFLVKLNPLTALFETFKYAFLGKGGSFNLHDFLYSLCFAIVLLVSGIFVFSKVEKRFIDVV